MEVVVTSADRSDQILLDDGRRNHGMSNWAEKGF